MLELAIIQCSNGQEDAIVKRFYLATVECVRDTDVNCENLKRNKIDILHLRSQLRLNNRRSASVINSSKNRSGFHSASRTRAMAQRPDR